MKVVIQHPSGAVYQGPHRLAGEWWSRFESATTIVEAEGAPYRESEVHSQVSTEQHRGFEYGEQSGERDWPVVVARRPFGFVRNEENAK